jgi:hypothetical protein
MQLFTSLDYYYIKGICAHAIPYTCHFSQSVVTNLESYAIFFSLKWHVRVT